MNKSKQLTIQEYVQEIIEGDKPYYNSLGDPLPWEKEKGKSYGNQ